MNESHPETQQQGPNHVPVQENNTVDAQFDAKRMVFFLVFAVAVIVVALVLESRM